MPSASNSNYCFGAKRRTIRSIGIKAIMATALLGHYCRGQSFG